MTIFDCGNIVNRGPSVDAALVRELYPVPDRFCRCFAGPERRLIMTSPAGGERCVGDIARELNLG